MDTPVIINYTTEPEIRAQARWALHEALGEIRKEVGIKIKIGVEEKFIGMPSIFDVEVDTRTIHIFRDDGTLPRGLGEVCGTRAMAKIDDSYEGSVGLIKHEILHVLGASHYKGFMNDVTDRVLRSIKKCLRRD